MGVGWHFKIKKTLLCKTQQNKPRWIFCYIFQSVGLELRGLLSSVDEYSKELPQNQHREVSNDKQNKPPIFFC